MAITAMAMRHKRFQKRFAELEVCASRRAGGRAAEWASVHTLYMRESVHD